MGVEAVDGRLMVAGARAFRDEKLHTGAFVREDVEHRVVCVGVDQDQLRFRGADKL